MTESVNQLVSYLGDYCERAGSPSMFAEPLNAATNLFFILAAYVSARALCSSTHRGEAGRGAVANGSLSAEFSLRSSPPPNLPPMGGGTKKNIDLWLLIGAMFSIGIGSGLWHLIPTAETVLMDVIPITFFIHVYLIATLRRAFHLSWPKVVCWWGLYLVVSIAAQVMLEPHLFHGTILYIPTYFTLMALTVCIYPKDRAIGRIFVKMLGLWTASLIFRTIDLDICAQFPIGTHFLWHTLNAWMLYRLAMVYIRPPQTSPLGEV